MVVDTSAVVAILLKEPEGPSFLIALRAASVRLISAATLLECAIVIEGRRGDPGGRDLDLLVHRSRMEVVPVTREQADIARHAWRRFGKGRHPAGLNYGDCFAYALSRSSGEPLLFKGGDFARTDVAGAV